MVKAVTQTSQDGDLIVLVFRVAGYWCAFRADRVQEMVANAAMAKVPGQPSILEGFLNLRGAILPVVRLAAFFNLPFESGLDATIIVIRHGKCSLGLLVSEVESVLTIDRSELRALAANHSANEYAEAEFAQEGRDVVLLDCDRLLLVEENRRIAELQSQVEQRLKALESVEP
jgi:purine-binding chemotaxis protein CheW